MAHFPLPDLVPLVARAFGPRARIVAVEPLAGDASTRRYARLTLAGDDVPETAVAMILADRAIAMSSDELAVFKDAPSELPYLNLHKFLEPLGTPVPQVLADASDAGLLLLEDVGDTTLWDTVQDTDEAGVLHWYGAAIDTLVALQVDGTRHAVPHCLAFQQSFDRRLFLWELEHFLEYGLEAPRGAPLPPDEAAALRRIFERIADELDAERRVLNHRDFHSWNLHVHRGRIRVIDFQDALLAPIAYDLATLLGDRDTPLVVRPHLEARLLERFRQAWQARSGEELDAARFQRSYFLCSLQKALKVVGRFIFLDRVKGKPAYLRFLPSTLRQVRRVRLQLPDLAGLDPFFDRYLPTAAEES